LIKLKHICVRHGSERKDSRLMSFFLCDNCFNLLRIKAFNNNQPVYTLPESSYIRGYCLYCGRDTNVRQHFYFLCEICERIVHSYGKELAARNFILSWWSSVRQQYGLGDIELSVEDPVIPMTYAAHQKYKKQSTPKPDFVAVKEGRVLFAIEMKAGRSSIEGMSSFQLDISDCDDILGFLQQPQYRVPTFLFHVQVLEDYKYPTVRYSGVNAWWASLFELEKNIENVKMRPRERRPAVYYKKNAFKQIHEFPNYILSGGLESEKELLNKRLPKLYPEKK